MTPETVFYYVHDPMCSWCWAHRPEWDRLKQALAPIVPVQTLVGGLAPDSDEPMPAEQQEAIAGYWRRIETMLGRPFNHDFWTQNVPRRSTYPACRAVIAARWQGRDEAMTEALQEAYYLRAMNPSDTETHLVLAAELGLDVDKLARDLSSAELEAACQDELTQAHQLPIQGFPSMVLQAGDKVWEVPLDYRDHRGALAFVREKLAQS